MKGVLQSNKTKPKLCFEAQTEKNKMKLVPLLLVILALYHNFLKYKIK